MHIYILFLGDVLVTFIQHNHFIMSTHVKNFKNLLLQQGNTILVDTPGFGGAIEFKKKLMEYLPNAVSLIFVISVERAGGLQDDRVNIKVNLNVVRESPNFLVTILKKKIRLVFVFFKYWGFFSYIDKCSFLMKKNWG